jgi:hypothetical protein
MSLRKLRPNQLPVIVTALFVFVLVGCSSSTGLIRSKLDPVTSVTITFSQFPIIFYREVSGRAAFARDYVYMAPLEVNRSGNYRYYLWLGIWNTIDDSPLGRSRDGFESIVLFADGEPLPLAIAGWTAEAIGASEPVYLKPVASATDAYFEVTVDQLRLIAEAKDLQLRSTSPRPSSYEPWDDQSSARASLSEFLEASSF